MKYGFYNTPTCSRNSAEHYGVHPVSLLYLSKIWLALRIIAHSLGKSGLKISKVILGTMSLGNANDQMPWTVPEEQALPLLKHALDKGINTWDTVSYTFSHIYRHS